MMFDLVLISSAEQQTLSRCTVDVLIDTALDEHRLAAALYLSLPEIVLVAVFVCSDKLLAFCENELSLRGIARLELFELDAFGCLDHDR